MVVPILPPSVDCPPMVASCLFIASLEESILPLAVSANLVAITNSFVAKSVPSGPINSEISALTFTAKDASFNSNPI